MIDFVLGIYLAGMILRGWLRGLVKEALDLAGLIIGAMLAFRMSGPFGDFVAERFGVTPEWARLGAGVVLFLLVGAGMALLAHWLGGLARMPGLGLINRLLGAGLAVGWGLVLIVALATVARALPLPTAVEEALDESVVLSTVAGPDSPPSRLFMTVAGDEVLEALVGLRQVVGDRRVILEDDQRVEFRPASPDELEERPGDARQVFDLVNRERIAERLAPLAWSEALAEVASGHAREMYLEGYMSHLSPTTGTVTDRVRAAGIRLVLVGENLALAADPRAVHAGLMSSPGHRANILQPEFDRVGIGAIRGPLGLMVVEVFGG